MKILQKTISHFDQEYRNDPSYEKANILGREVFRKILWLDKETQLEAWEFVYLNTIQFGNEILSHVANGASKLNPTPEQRENLIEGLSGVSLIQKKLKINSILITKNNPQDTKENTALQPFFDKIRTLLENFESKYNPQKLTSPVLISQLGNSLGKEIISISSEFQLSAWEIVHEKFKHNFPGVLISLAKNASLYIDEPYQRQHLINGLSGMSLLNKQTVETHPKLHSTSQIIDNFILSNSEGKSSAKDIETFAEQLVKKIEGLSNDLQLLGWEMVYVSVKDFSGAFKDHFSRCAAKNIKNEVHLRNFIDGVTGYSLMQKNSVIKNALDKQLIAQKINNDLNSDELYNLDPRLKPLEEIMIQFFSDFQQYPTNEKIAKFGKNLGKEIVVLPEKLQEEAWIIVGSEFKEMNLNFFTQLAKNASEYTVEPYQRKYLINGISGYAEFENNFSHIKKTKNSFIKN